MFTNRQEAGELLAEKLVEFKNKKDVLVLGIPRGGVVVAKIIADMLSLPLDIIVVKKISLPINPELAIGAVGPEKTVYWDEELCKRLDVSREVRRKEMRVKDQERSEREKILRGEKKAPSFRNKTVLLVDDGIATGATVLVSAKYLKKKKVKGLILAVPVISNDTFRGISKYFDRMVFLEVSSEFGAVGQFYEEFTQISDETVKKLFDRR
ncbi:MAG: hypothetical protein A3F31_00315 [Candidatus Levybacteria bacterium RIFCSPHIGHO2_12_FULL_38_12]|nr:MAG: hypothetical protein A2770_03385 [Candidatus Levybacteria bacterium RIFCSPHIGHO2_01_FULL_38_12]OGH23202.1 MAG: hypothetical protein A3F31_00315 [Candidatus Levybacteria bacterium RIFCSPHIGHO2_12_FULL_38_12]OGH34480.1 MAG: hypothetical protein A3A47_00835 [Candidatus Levybacteria bacterium RIFCSPLOWO2_01_FULL_37_20]OGH44728.1 MAG: hypothetical protein A3J14_00195 [Candidatus Levybacteria bacterium RIFCSPLOWO2_02_FULL_37_18]OGH51085.1 MAG: hypothetical protein A3G13_02430 [Candidatus Levy